MSTKDKDKDTVTPKNLRSQAQSLKDSPSVKKVSEKGAEKTSEKDKVSEKSAKDPKVPEKPTKDPKQPSITDYQVEPSDKQTQALILNEIKNFNKEVRGLFDEMEKKMEKMDQKMESIDKKMDDRFKTMDEKFSMLHSGMEKEVNQLKEDMLESKTEIENTNKKVSEFEREIDKSLEFQSEKLKDQLKKVEDDQEKKLEKAEKALDKKITELDNKLKLLEKHDRKYNLLFYGIAEPEEEEVEDPIEKLRTLFVDDLNIDMTIANRMQFTHGHRVPSRGKGPRPIILRFLSYQDRELVLNNAKLLAGSKRRILVDLPTSMKIERDRLAKEAFHIRKKEDMQTRIKDKGLDVYLEVRKKSTDKWVKRAV